MKEKIVDIIKGIVADFDVEETALIDNGVLSSLEVLQVIVEINNEFNISIPASAIKPENFNSVVAISKVVESAIEGRE